MALAVAALPSAQVGRIILTRPAVEAGERLGFLPGDMLAKVDPYLRPLFDALYDMLEPDRLNAYMERGTIEVAPLAFMRGRTLNDSFIILDEAQNTTPEQMQMFLTRLGFGSKVVVTGDVTQIDLPREQASGLIQVQDILGSIDGIEFVQLRARGRRPPQARPAHRRGVQAPRGGDRHAAAPMTVAIELANRSGVAVEEAAARGARPFGARSGGNRGGRARHRVRRAGRDPRLKREHLGIDEATDVLSFPLDGRDDAAGGGAAPARRRGGVPAGGGDGMARAARPRSAASPRLRARPGDGGRERSYGGWS